jgi:hypothetical protein
VGVDARVTAEGVAYEVDPNLAGATVLLWWELFDQELYVEHGEQPYGPYQPVDGPIPLHRYRCFKTTTLQQRVDRLEALAAQLALPRAAVEHDRTRALEEGHKSGQKPLTPDLIESVLARDLDDLEPRLTRHGYNANALADLRQVRPTDIRAFLAGQLPPSRTQAWQQALLAAGLPL